MGLKAFLKMREEGVRKISRTGGKDTAAKKLGRFLKGSSYTLPYKVVGVTFEGRQNILKKYFDENQKTAKLHKCNLVLDDENPYDKNAVAVFICGDGMPEQIGFLGKDVNCQVREDFQYIKDVEVKKFGITSDGIIGVSIDVKYEED